MWKEGEVCSNDHDPSKAVEVPIFRTTNPSGKSRLECNREIVERLQYYVEKFPDWRFGQLLQNLGVVGRGDCFYIESEDSLRNMNKLIEKDK